MRILFCNKYNYRFSGTEAYIFQAMDLLRSRGHETALFSMADARGEPTPYDRYFVPQVDFKKRSPLREINLAASAIYSSAARRRIAAMIRDFRPDVAHVRNIYHHLSPSILWELKAQKIPVVYHLNDFKALCPTYNLLSHGNACEKCKHGKFWHALEEKCYPGRGARIVLVAEAYFHKWLGTYRKNVDCFLAPSQFVRDKFVEHGWDASRFEVLPHFQPLEQILPESSRVFQDAPLLYFGRLSPEKGVEDLLRAMQRLPDLRLVIAGDGPERPHLEGLAASLGLSNVCFAGNLQGRELERAIIDSRFTVLPSHAYETLGKTVLESYAYGRAVIATDLGSRRELVQDGKTGLLYKTGNVAELVSAVRFLSSLPRMADTMGAAGRELVRHRYAPEAHYEKLVGLYERLCNEKRQSSPIRFRLPAGPDQKLKIAFIGGRGVVSKYSGIESYYEEVGGRLATMGHQVTIYCRNYFTPAGTERNGMRIVRLPTIRSKHLETLVHTFLSTLHVLVHRCDVVHYHALGPALFSFLPRLAGKKTIVTVQGLDWQRKKWGRFASLILRLGEKAAARLPNHTMVVSRTLQNNYFANGAPTSYVPNGGELREWHAPERIFEWGLTPGKYILFLGRLSPEKGCHLLIEAFEKLTTDVKLVIAGASSYCDEYSRRLREHAGERILILNWVSGVVLDELLTNAMIFVLPSDIEGLSLALLDAMGAGLCVVASDLSENREAVENAGFTFRRGDSKDLSERLAFLVANPAVREAAGEAAKRRVQQHYQWSKISAEVERVYFEVMDWELPVSAPRKPSASVKEPTPAWKRVAG